MAQTAAHLVDHVIPPVPVRQWVISVPKRLRCFLANRPEAVAALTKIFLAEIERLLSAAAAVTIDAAAPAAARPRLGAISFLHRFGSALNHHVHRTRRPTVSGGVVDGGDTGGDTGATRGGQNVIISLVWQIKGWATRPNLQDDMEHRTFHGPLRTQ